jgi:hypothetical protein
MMIHQPRPQSNRKRNPAGETPWWWICGHIPVHGMHVHAGSHSQVRVKQHNVRLAAGMAAAQNVWIQAVFMRLQKRIGLPH